MGYTTPFFILSRHWTEVPSGIQLRYWLINDNRRFCWCPELQESVCFVEQEKLADWRLIWQKMSGVRVGEKQLQTLTHVPVVPIYSTTVTLQRQWVKKGRGRGLKVWEDDVFPADRYLMERFLFGSLRFDESQVPSPAESQPNLHVLSIDIETSWYVPGKLPTLYSIAFAGLDLNKVILIKPGHTSVEIALDSDIDVSRHEDVKSALIEVVSTIQQYDPDCLIGWNLIDFDLRLLQSHCDAQGVSFAIGRDATPPRWRTRTDNRERFFIDVEGRQVVDGPGAFRSAAWYFEDFSLETVARSVLQRGKRIAHSDDRSNEIDRLFQEDLSAFIRYNLEDARLVIDLFDAAGIWQFLIQRSHLTGLPMERAGGSAAAFNTVYMPRLHRHGYIAFNVGDQALNEHSPGGYVMDSDPGIYSNVLVLDFKSLYPSIIRTFCVDPLGLAEGLLLPEAETLPGFLGARFHRDRHILPALIGQLAEAREVAKASRNEPLSQAIKIIMNSFYGVLGSNLCRFFDPRLASSITRRGHEIMRRSREFIESEGFQVIYGDTDSVFVHIGDQPSPEAIGKQLAEQLNVWWRDSLRSELNLNSFLEIEFDALYQRFVMPTIRGTDTGSKKRYAGWQKVGDEFQVVIKGMEAIRSDWTPLAKRFQLELYRRFFEGADYIKFIADTAADLVAGKLDDELVYSRRLRREVELYQKQLPPQVQAAWIKRKQQPQWRGRKINYVKTLAGWQPVEYVRSAIDYEHYLERQLAPIADALLHFNHESFEKAAGQQLSLF